MSRYDSLAEQVAQDFRMTMLAFSAIQREVGEARKYVRRTYRTIRTMLKHEREQNARLDALEAWKEEVDHRQSA